MTVDKKFLTIDNKIETLREMRVRANASIVADFDEKLDVSWIYHDNALEGVVLSYHELKAAIDKKIISDVSLIPMYEEIKNHKAAIELVRADGAPVGGRSARGEEERQGEEESDHARDAQAAALGADARGEGQGESVPQGQPAPSPLLPRDRAARQDRAAHEEARRVAGRGRDAAPASRSSARRARTIASWRSTRGRRTRARWRAC